MASYSELRWPFKANGEMVNDYAGEFVAAAVDPKTARLLAAAPYLLLYFKATRNAIASLPEEARKTFESMVAGPRDAAAETLEGLL